MRNKKYNLLFVLLFAILIIIITSLISLNNNGEWNEEEFDKEIQVILENFNNNFEKFELVTNYFEKNNSEYFAVYKWDGFNKMEIDDKEVAKEIIYIMKKLKCWAIINSEESVEFSFDTDFNDLQHILKYYKYGKTPEQWYLDYSDLIRDNYYYYTFVEE